MPDRQTRDEREAEKRAAELEKRRGIEAARVAEHNRRVAASASAPIVRPGRIVSKPRPLPVKPIDLEAGRYRMARPLGGKRPTHNPYPDDAAEAFGSTLNCPHCGYPMLSYWGRGAYYCSGRRVVQSKYQTSGCGRYSYGPHNPHETPYSDRERVSLEDPELLPM